MADVHRMATVAFKREGDALMLIGDTRDISANRSICAKSKAAKKALHRRSISLPRKQQRRFRAQADRRWARRHRATISPTAGCWSRSPRWRWRAISARTLAGTTVDAIPFFYGEDQARYLIAVPQRDAGEHRWRAATRPASPRLPSARPAAITIARRRQGEIALPTLRKAHEGWFPAYMGGEEIPPTN